MTHRGPFQPLLFCDSVILVLRAPELNAVLQVRSHQSRVEGQNHLSRPVGHASLDAAQDTVGLLGCEHTLLSHVELLISWHPQVLLLRAALNPFSTQPVFVLGIASTQVQDLALGLVQLHEVRTGPPLKAVQVPLGGIPCLQPVDHTTQLGVVGRLAEGAPSPTVHVASKDVTSAGPNTEPRGTPLVTGLHLDMELLTASSEMPVVQFVLLNRNRLHGYSCCAKEGLRCFGFDGLAKKLPRRQMGSWGALGGVWPAGRGRFSTPPPPSEALSGVLCPFLDSPVQER